MALSSEQIDALRQVDTPALSNAIESFDVRLRNEGFTDASIRCLFPSLPPMVGYAVTAKVHCSSPPPMGEHHYLDRNDWWNLLLRIPEPRVVVVQDVDERRGAGSLIGAVHANVLRALGCVGAVTDGSVRDLPEIQAAGFQLFASSVTVSHAYAHIVEFGTDVEVGGLKVSPGDLLHGDAHGVLSVPLDIAAQLPAAAAKIAERERQLIAVCRAKGFSLEKLRAAIKASS